VKNPAPLDDRRKRPAGDGASGVASAFAPAATSSTAVTRTRYAFLTLPDYSMIALANAVEPLRMANRVSGQVAYEWTIASLDGRPAKASNGMMLTPTSGLADLGGADLVFVVGGINVRDAVSPALTIALRRLAARRMPLGALCSGGYALACAGLLDGYRATIHWENLSALREEFPRVLISDHLFTLDRNRYTCSGGVAPLELMLNLIEQKLGPEVSQRVSEQFIVERIRDADDRQYVPLRARVGNVHRTVIAVASLMEANIENPLALEEIARRSGLSRRQIERLFQRHVNCVPKRYYLELRLKRARELLLQTAMPIMSISTACGFKSPPHFSKCYRAHYGRPPTAERQPRRGQALAIQARDGFPGKT
jgi:transcriptional regulator GlxA family with amidase domain